jgi:hypothetical protein
MLQEEAAPTPNPHVFWRSQTPFARAASPAFGVLRKSRKKCWNGGEQPVISVRRKRNHDDLRPLSRLIFLISFEFSP